MLCSECGYLNESYLKICSECGRPLPDRTTPPPRLEGHLRELESACRRVKTREISSGDFRNLLNRMENIFKKTKDDVEKMEFPSEYREEFQEELNTGIGGVKLYIEAIHEMHSYLDTREEHFLDRGMMMARNANDRINDALRINFENYRALQDTAEEFLASIPRV